MKNKKLGTILFHGFIICSSILLIVCSQFIYSQHENTELGRTELITSSYEELESLVIYKEMELNPKYEPLIFSKNVDEKTQEKIKKAFIKRVEEQALLLDKDASFHYVIKDKTTKKEMKSDQNVSKDSFFSGTIVTTSNQVVNCDGDFKGFLFLQDIEPIDFIYMEEFNDVYFENHDVTFNIPKDIEVQFMLDQDISMRSYYRDLYDNLYQSAKEEACDEIFAVEMLSLTGILTIFVLILKYEDEKEMIPFVWIKNWLFEISFFVLGSLTTVLCAGTNAISMGIVLSLYDQYPIVLVYILGIVVLMLTQYLIASCIFVVKDMVKKGIPTYVKENTLLGRWICWMVKNGKDILQEDLSHPLYKRVFLLLVLNLVLVGMLYVFNWFGLFLDLILTIVLMGYVLKELKKIQLDYAHVLNKSNELAKGNFSSNEDDFGVFNTLGQSLDSIQSGFEKAVQEEVKSQNMKNELISNVSHDLKTPLTCIKNYTTLLQDESLDEKTRKEYMKNLEYYTNRMQVCIQDLFDISKVNSQSIKLNISRLDLIALTKQVLFECEESFQQKNLHVIDNLKGNAFVELDGEKTVRILENLFVNISKYALDNSRVYFDMKKEEESISLIFKNISQEAMNFTPDEIVERFVRGDKSRHETGSGLGLAIVKSFSEAQGGNFEIKIEGDLFMTILTFPLSSQEEK